MILDGTHAAWWIERALKRVENRANFHWPCEENRRKSPSSLPCAHGIKIMEMEILLSFVDCSECNCTFPSTTAAHHASNNDSRECGISIWVDLRGWEQKAVGATFVISLKLLLLHMARVKTRNSWKFGSIGSDEAPSMSAVPKPLKIINLTNSSSSVLRISYISCVKSSVGCWRCVCTKAGESETGILGKMRWEPKNPEIPVLMSDDDEVLLEDAFFYYSVMSSSWIFLYAGFFCCFGMRKNQRKLNLIKKNHVQLFVCVIGDLLARNLLQQVLFVIVVSETLCALKLCNESWDRIEFAFCSVQSWWMRSALIFLMTAQALAVLACKNVIM